MPTNLGRAMEGDTPDEYPEDTESSSSIAEIVERVRERRRARQEVHDALVTMARLVSECDNEHGERHAWAVLMAGPLAEVASQPPQKEEPPCG